MQRLTDTLKGLGLAFLTILVPPLGIGIKRGFGYYFWVCLILTFMGYVPGLLYATYRSMYAPGESLFTMTFELRQKENKDMSPTNYHRHE